MMKIVQYIENLRQGQEVEVTFDQFKEKLQEDHPTLMIKEDDALALIYSPDESDGELEKECRSCVLDKETLGVICQQFRHIVYNDPEAVEGWPEDLIIQESYEGTMLTVFNHHDTWYVSTRRCLDAGKSMWVQNKSYREMFDEAMEGKFEFDELDPNLCYSFVLVHHLNQNIISYHRHPLFGPKYKKLVHIMTRTKGTLEEVDVTINDRAVLSTARDVPEDSLIKSTNYRHRLRSKEDMFVLLEKMNGYNRHSVLKEGLVVRQYVDGQCHVLKYQTDRYVTVKEMKPNNSNQYQGYVELFQSGKLPEYLNHFGNMAPEAKGKIVNQISRALKTLTVELLLLYHQTRNHGKEDVYQNLSGSYKEAIYMLHGMYIEKKNQSEQEKVKIEYEDVYKLLKNQMPAQKVCHMFRDRKQMMVDQVGLPARFCQSTDKMTQLMFPQ